MLHNVGKYKFSVYLYVFWGITYYMLQLAASLVKRNSRSEQHKYDMNMREDMVSFCNSLLRSSVWKEVVTLNYFYSTMSLLYACLLNTCTKHTYMKMCVQLTRKHKISNAQCKF